MGAGIQWQKNLFRLRPGNDSAGHEQRGPWYAVAIQSDGILLSPSPSTGGPVTGYGPGACTRRPIVPRTSGHLALTRGSPPGDC